MRIGLSGGTDGERGVADTSNGPTAGGLRNRGGIGTRCASRRSIGHSGRRRLGWIRRRLRGAATAAVRTENSRGSLTSPAAISLSLCVGGWCDRPPASIKIFQPSRCFAWPIYILLAIERVDEMGRFMTLVIRTTGTDNM